MLIALGGFPFAQAQDIQQELTETNKVENTILKQETALPTLVESDKDDILFVQEEEEEEPKKLYDNFSIAIQSKNYTKIDNYLNQGANINHNLYNGNTIVHISAFHRDLDFLFFAADRKANLSQLNDNNESILYWAAGGSSVQYLEEARAILGKNFNSLLNKQNKVGRTPLHSAMIYSSNIDVINWLIDNKLDMSAKDIDGKTALHYAAGMRKWLALEAMLKKGGNINEIDNEGKTVEEYIFERMDILSVEIFHPYVSQKRKVFIEESVGKIFPEKLLTINPKYKLTRLQADKIKSSKEDFIYGKEIIK